MQEWTPSSVDEDQLLGAELEKLFALQDKPLAKDKKGILVRELANTGIPFKALLSGLRALMNEDLGSIKFQTICAVSRRFVEQGPAAATCANCSDGFVIMKDPNGMLFSFGCSCGAGAERMRANAIVRWNGEDTQHSKGRLLTRMVRA